VAGVSSEDVAITAALLASVETERNNMNAGTYEPLNAEQRKRETGQPCGLKNIGNTCYFNSILQVYYNIPEFVNLIFEFRDDEPPLVAAKKVEQASAGTGAAQPQNA